MENGRLPLFACILFSMEKKPPADDSKNRFAEVIRKSQERRQELNNKAKKKQAEEMEPLLRDEEGPEPEEGDPGI
jgi:predicted secreted protein